MTTAATAVDRTRHTYLLAGQREQRNRLTSAVDADDTSLTFDFALGSIQENARLSVGFEECGVWTVNAGTKTAEVQRADFGSAGVAHDAATVVLVNSIFAPHRVLGAIRDEVATLPGAGLFRMQSVDLTYDSSVQGYDLTGVTDLLSVYEVRAKVTGPEEAWPILDSWDLARGMPTGTFPSGLAIVFRDEGDPGQVIRVKYRAPFAAVVDETTDLQTTCGLPASADDLVQIGAAIRLVAPREVKRNFTEHQGDTRRGEETPAGSQLQSVRGLLAVWERRLGEEKRRLLEQFPPRKRVTATL